MNPYFFRKSLSAFTLAAASCLSHPVMACSSCGCTLSSDWDAQGISGTPGLKLDLRYDYINQNQLRTGGHKASDTEIGAALAAGSLGEVEQGTLNRYYTLGLDYSSGKTWGVNLQLPFYDRTHSTVADGVTSTSDFHELADIRVVGRYQGWSPDGDSGLLFGVKLPTGKTTSTFSSGEPLDRSLQAGTGSTDLIVGIFRFGSLSRNWDWFGQGLYQAAIKTKDDYRPGNALNLNAGVRYMNWGSLVPQLQINAKTGARDTGTNADTVNSGGTLVYLSPGLTFKAGKAARIYGFVQLPIYQHVNGFQLAPRWNASIGTTLSF
jgi:hypothetical protein